MGPDRTRRRLVARLVVGAVLLAAPGCASGGDGARRFGGASSDAGPAPIDAPEMADVPTPMEEPICGDASCGEAETCTSCPEDCGACRPRCGDDECSPEETSASCAADCAVEPVPFCGDGECQSRETCANCSTDCGRCEPRCGDGICTPDVETCSSCSRDCC